MNGETTRFNFSADRTLEAREIMSYVVNALEEKGYDPINQLVGYFISSDPTYITSHKGARGYIKRMERDELLEMIIKEYCTLLK